MNRLYFDTTGLFYLPLHIDQLAYPLPTQDSTATVASESVSPTTAVPCIAPTKTVTTIVYASNVPESTATVIGDDAQETITVTYLYGMAYNAYISPYTPDKDDMWRDDFDEFCAMYFNFNSHENNLLTCGVATGDIDFQGVGYSMLPGQSVATDVSAIAIVYHGYLLAPMTGLYYFDPGFDDFGGVWIGDDAYANWTWDNVNARGGYSDFQGGFDHPFDLNEGDLLPCTIIAANAYDYFSIGLQLYVDGRKTFITDFTGYFIQPHLEDPWSPAVRDPASCPLPPQQPGVKPTCDGKLGTEYVNYYSGTGYTEQYSDQRDFSYPPIVNQYDASYDVFSVAELCGNKTIADTHNGYYSFDVHFVTTSNMWECVEFWTPDKDVSYFDEANNSIREAYGWCIYGDDF